MKKIGYFFSGFLPLVTAIAIQTLASFFMIGIAALFLCPAVPSLRHGSFDITELQTLLTSINFNACIMLIYSITCIVFFGLWYYRSCGGNYRPDIRRTFHPLQLAAIVVLVPGMQFFSSYLTAFVSMIFPSWLRQYEKLMETAGLTTDIGVLMFFYSVLSGPICEELIFRGVTMRLFRRALPFWAANLMQAILFGAFHMNWIQGIYAFALGLVLGILCEKGGSIYCSILFHILFNFWGTVLSQILEPLENSAALGIVMLLTTIVSLALGAFLFRAGDRRKKRKIAAIIDHDDFSGESE